MKMAVVPYQIYQFSELPKQLQERLLSRQKQEPDYAYQFVIGFERPVWQTFLVGTVIVPAYIYGLYVVFTPIPAAILAIFLLAPICFLCSWVVERWRKLSFQKYRLLDNIYTTTHYIIVVRRQAVTYYPISEISELRVDETVYMASPGEYKSAFWLLFKDKQEIKGMQVNGLPMKGAKNPFNWKSMQEFQVERAKSHGMYEAQDDLAL